MKTKRITAVLLLAASLLFCLCACHERGEKKQKEEPRRDSFIIVHSPEATDRQVAATLASRLSQDGESVAVFEAQLSEDIKSEAVKAVIAVGRSVYTDITKDDDIPVIYCATDGGGEIDGASGIAPTLESRDIADCAMVLIPEAVSFSMISSVEGGKDVLGACDLLDETGKDYTVESLDGRIYGEVLLSCLESSADALLLPAGACGNRNASAAALPYIPESNIPVIAHGMGEPIKGALATFCIDSQAVSEALYQLINSQLYGIEPIYPESYYVLCISKERATCLDEQSKKNICQLFPVTWVD